MLLNTIKKAKTIIVRSKEGKEKVEATKMHMRPEEEKLFENSEEYKNRRAGYTHIHKRGSRMDGW